MLRRIVFHIQLTLFKALIKSKNAWLIFDKVGIKGFGTNLIRLYFPIYYDVNPQRKSFSKKLQLQFVNRFEARNYDEYNSSIVMELPEILQLPNNEVDVDKPYLDNYYFGILDAAVLSVMMQKHKPSKIIEIGSGISTRYMKLFKDKHQLKTEIICIDPSPRVDISSVTQQIIRKSFEDVVDTISVDTGSGDFIFLDGSHYVFQGNDTLCFFFNLLPALTSGAIVHIHDIYLPEDYSDSVKDQLWAEQYLLAAMIAGGMDDYEILYPTYYLCKTNTAIVDAMRDVQIRIEKRKFQFSLRNSEGYSFWMRKK